MASNVTNYGTTYTGPIWGRGTCSMIDTTASNAAGAQSTMHSFLGVDTSQSATSPGTVATIAASHVGTGTDNSGQLVVSCNLGTGANNLIAAATFTSTSVTSNLLFYAPSGIDVAAGSLTLSSSGTLAMTAAAGVVTFTGTPIMPGVALTNGIINSSTGSSLSLRVSNTPIMSISSSGSLTVAGSTPTITSGSTLIIGSTSSTGLTFAAAGLVTAPNVLSVTGTMNVKAANNANKFQVLNNSGTNIFNVNTLANSIQVALNVGGTGSQVLYVDTGGNMLSSGTMPSGIIYNNITLAGTTTCSGLTASQAVVTNSSSQLISMPYSTTGTASSLVARDSSGNFTTGAITASALTSTSNVGSVTGTFSGALSANSMVVSTTLGAGATTLTSLTVTGASILAGMSATTGSFSTSLTSTGTLTVSGLSTINAITASGLLNLTGGNVSTGPFCTIAANGTTTVLQVAGYANFASTVTVASLSANSITYTGASAMTFTGNAGITVPVGTIVAGGGVTGNVTGNLINPSNSTVSTFGNLSTTFSGSNNGNAGLAAVSVSGDASSSSTILGLSITNTHTLNGFETSTIAMTAPGAGGRPATCNITAGVVPSIQGVLNTSTWDGLSISSAAIAGNATIPGATCMFYNPSHTAGTPVVVGFASGAASGTICQLGTFTYASGSMSFASGSYNSGTTALVTFNVTNNSAVSGSNAALSLSSYTTALQTGTITQNGVNMVIAPPGSGVVGTLANMVPYADNTYSCGSSTLRWSMVYTEAISVSSALHTTTITQTGADVVIAPSSAGVVGTLANMVPYADNTYSCGSSALRWSVVYAATGTINTSAEETKTDIAAASLGTDFIMKLKPISYRRKSGKRTHHGLGAGQVFDALKSCGLDGNDFAGYVDPAATGMEGNKGLRYCEFIAPMIVMLQAQQKTIDELRAAIQIRKPTPSLSSDFESLSGSFTNMSSMSSSISTPSLLSPTSTDSGEHS